MNYRREFLHSAGMVAAGIGGYSAYVHNVKPEVRPDASFRTGTVDDQIMDELRTGDVVLFDRSWVKRHILPAVVVSLNKSVFGDTNFDHCALIVRGALGEVFLYEMSPKGPVLRPYAPRIANSRCRQIVVLPLTPPLKLDDAGIKGVFADLEERSKAQAMSSCTYYAKCALGYMTAYIDQYKNVPPRITYGRSEGEKTDVAVAYSPVAAELSAAVRIIAKRAVTQSSGTSSDDTATKSDSGSAGGGDGSGAAMMIPSGPGLTCKLLYDRRSKYSEPQKTITVRSL